MSEGFTNITGYGAEGFKEPVADVASLPIVGSANGDLRVVLDTQDIYVFDGSAWQLRSGSGGGGGAVDSVNGHTGTVVLTKSDLSLGNVDNTSDANKPISSAAQTALDAKVAGPASATDNAIARFDATTGKLIQNSSASIDDSGNISATNLSGTNTGDVSVLDTNSVDLTLTGQQVSADVRRSGSTLAEDASGIKVADGGITNTQVASGIDAVKIADGSVSNTEFQYLDGVSSAIQTQLNARPIPQAPSVNAWLYVSQQGSDVTGDGTYHKPFATTAAAQAAITDASTSKRYGIHIKGTITETNIYLRPFVYYYGDTWGASRLNATSGSIALHPTEFASGNSRCGMTNIYLTGSTGISLDFVSAAASGSHVVEIQDIGVNGAVVITPNNTNQYFQWRGSLCFSNFTVHGAGGSFTDLFLVGNLVVDNGSVPVANLGVNFMSTFIGGSLSMTASSSLSNIVQLSGSAVMGSIAVSGTGSDLQSDISSVGLNSTITLSSGGLFTRLSDVKNARYVPTTSSDWSTTPSEPASALDELAARSPKLSGPITLTDNTLSATTAFSFAKSNKFATLLYTIERNSVARMGFLMIVNDGTTASISTDSTTTADTGIVLSAIVNGSNIDVQYTATSTGSNASFKYKLEKW